ncbi:VF530 family DNA-binding protein [Psychromonas hadalis]|uniref:VF530 family DNA-binding protein n=1 Tax=Psychromonas hadalis TaxID=211669 RepID=UPI0003B6B6CC|nr:VF530 family DNA-binding protein [Psychromonas hadalis]
MTHLELPQSKKSVSPLYGLKLDQLLTEISDHYGWLCLSETLNIERFQFHTGLKSTMKFLRNHEWAKEKVENFYLYVYKNFAWPDDKQLMIPPRDRSSLGEPLADTPSEIMAETNALIEHASDMRGSKKNNTRQNSSDDEPVYDPNNPWNT